MLSAIVSIVGVILYIVLGGYRGNSEEHNICIYSEREGDYNEDLNIK